jgi:hypothetical protein
MSLLLSMVHVPSFSSNSAGTKASRSITLTCSPIDSSPFWLYPWLQIPQVMNIDYPRQVFESVADDEHNQEHIHSSYIFIFVGYCSHQSLQIRARIVTLICFLLIILPIDRSTIVALAFASIILIPGKVDAPSASLLWMIDLILDHLNSDL